MTFSFSNFQTGLQTEILHLSSLQSFLSAGLLQCDFICFKVYSKNSFISFLQMLVTEDSDSDNNGPLIKRLKLNKANIKLEAVLGDEVTQAVPLIPVLAANIKNKKFTSLLVKKLNANLPLEKLQHLKRVNSRKINNVTVISVILWQLDSDHHTTETVSREAYQDRLNVLGDIDLDEALEDDLQVFMVASYQPFTVTQNNQLKELDNYW